MKLALGLGLRRRRRKGPGSILGLDDRVRFMPFSKLVNRYYAAADAFVFPTIYDPFGMVITEAMASGLPVITSRAAGAAELIRHDESGRLTDDPWNVDQIAEGLSKMAGDAAYLAMLGRNARSAVETRTWDRTRPKLWTSIEK